MADVSVRGLVFTDIEGSTSLVRLLGRGFDAVLERHHEIIRSAIRPAGGVEQSREGDSMFITFPSASAAVEGALEAQRRLESEPWPGGGRVRVRMGIHVGEVAETGAGLVGLAIHQAARMMSAAHGGQIVASGDVSRQADRIPSGVTLRPLGQYDLRDIGRVRLYQLDHAELQRDFPRLRTRRALADNLPSPLTSLVGRSDEAAVVREQLEEHRLITLLGAGGCGKTRLALRVATDGLERFVDGVWFVDLAPLRPAADVTPQVAQTLGINGGRDDVLAALREREMLLVFDNCEHVLDSAGELIAALLESCPLARVIATSRAPLNLAGEVRFHVPPLSVPPPTADVGEIEASESVQLFVARAGLVRSGFSVDQTTSSEIAAVCARLDGIPLAIELAAARLGGMSLGDLARRLDDRFGVLAGGPRSAPERHWTMRNTLDWTFELLGADEQLVLRQLAVFRGGCDLEAIEATSADLVPSGRSLIDVVIELVDRSLLSIVEADGSTRYGLHEAVRDYVLGSAGTDGREQAERRHAEWCAGLAAGLRDGPQPAGDVAWIRRHEVERENFRAAAEWLADRRPDVALRLLLDAEGGTMMTMQASWLVDLVRRVLPVAGDAPSTLRAEATSMLAWEARDMDRLDEALELCDRSVELLAESDDPIARCTVMATVAVCHADAAGGVLDERIVSDAVAASDRAGGTYWPILTRYALVARSPLEVVEPLTSAALRTAQRFRLDFFANALIRGTLAVGTQFRAPSAVVLQEWRDLVPALDDLGLYQDNNASFYALAEGEHADLAIGLHLADHFLTRLRAHRFDPAFEAALRWVVAHLCRLRGDTDRAADSVELADRIATPRFDFLGRLATITRSAVHRACGQPDAAAALIASQVPRQPHVGLTDIRMRLLEEFAAVADACGRAQDSADLLATAAAHRRHQQMPLSPACRIEVDRLQATVAEGTPLDHEAIRGLATSLRGPT
jgi:predicted ATPase/class 3 adenylate cyclase